MYQTVKKYLTQTFLTLFIAAFTAHGWSVCAQDAPLTLVPGETTVAGLMSQIEGQTSFRFVVRHKEYDLTRKVTVPGAASTMEQVLAILVDGTGKTYVKDGNYIIVPVDKPASAVKQAGVIEGSVYDDSGRKSMAGVTIEIIGGNFPAGRPKATSDRNGRFSIVDVPAGKYVLKFSAASAPARYSEVSVAQGKTVRADMTFTAAPQSEFTAPAQVLSLETNPIKSPASYERIEHSVDMPAAQSYVLMPAREPARSYQPKTAVKTNLLYWATLTPNASLEFYLAPKWTLDTYFGYNAWDTGSTSGFVHWMVQPEARYWFCNAFERHFVGLHGIYGKFNIKNAELPFTNKFVDHHYKGYGVGAGVSWGYHLPLARRWGMEFSVGAGYVYLQYDKYKCSDCDEYEGKFYKHYFGPTKAAVSLVFMIN